jgi:hypothetical protein
VTVPVSYPPAVTPAAPAIDLAADWAWRWPHVRFGVWVHPSGRRDNWRYRLRHRRMGKRFLPYGSRKWAWPTVERC